MSGGPPSLPSGQPAPRIQRPEPVSLAAAAQQAIDTLDQAGDHFEILVKKNEDGSPLTADTFERMLIAIGKSLKPKRLKVAEMGVEMAWVDSLFVRFIVYPRGLRGRW